MNDTDAMMLDAARRLLADLGPTARGTGGPAALHDAFGASGFAHALVPEARGGIGLGWPAAGALFHEFGRHAVPAPTVETMLAARILSDAGCHPPAGLITLADTPRPVPCAGEAQGAGYTLHRVPWGGRAGFVVAPALPAGENGLALMVVDAERVASRGANLAGEDRDTLSFMHEACTFAGTSALSATGIRAVGAAARSAMIAGALDALLALCLDYTGVRAQFGKTLRSFQVIQHALAQLASLASATRAASDSAFRALEEADGTAVCASELLPVVAAKVYCGEAAGQGAALAHQMFGAIGFTEEHVLHRYTTRLWSWRDEFGGDTYWAQFLGTRMARAGGDGLWPALTRTRLPAATGGRP